MGPSWGDQITGKAPTVARHLPLLVAAYIAWPLEWRMAVAALVGGGPRHHHHRRIYSVFRFEVTPATVIAFLTILGFSLYDTVVVYDKVREHAGLAGGGRTRTPRW